MTRRLLRLLRTFVLLLLLAVLAIYVWPTRFRDDHISVDGNTYPVRIDRVTGAGDMLVPDQGWVPVEGDPGDENSDNGQNTQSRL